MDYKNVVTHNLGFYNSGIPWEAKRRTCLVLLGYKCEFGRLLQVLGHAENFQNNIALWILSNQQPAHSKEHLTHNLAYLSHLFLSTRLVYIQIALFPAQFELI